jgi:hypothetical protein
VQNKIASFYRVIINESRAKRKAAFFDIREKFNDSVDDFLKSEINKCEDGVKKEKKKIETREIKNIIKKNNLDKKNLIIKRENLKNDLFLKIESRLKNFTNSKLYFNFVSNEINKTDKNNILKIEFNKKDSELVIKLKELFNFDFNFIFSEDEFIGGFKVYLKSPKAVIDKTFKAKLNFEKNNFNKINLAN